MMGGFPKHPLSNPYKTVSLQTIQSVLLKIGNAPVEKKKSKKRSKKESGDEDFVNEKPKKKRKRI